MDRKEYYSREYDFKEISPDKRFQQAWKEARYVLATFFVTALLIIILMYSLGGGEPADYTYLFGHPLWFTCSMLALFGGLLAAMIITKTVFKDMELGETNPENLIPIVEHGKEEDGK